MAEGARLESVFRGNSNAGSNPALSARFFIYNLCPSLYPQKKIDSPGSSWPYRDSWPSPFGQAVAGRSERHSLRSDQFLLGCRRA